MCDLAKPSVLSIKKDLEVAGFDVSFSNSARMKRSNDRNWLFADEARNLKQVRFRG
jgi:hypothetical protein